MSSVAPNQGLYFIAVIPEEPVLSDAQKWKEHFANRYNSKASLNSPPHVTLHMPFKCKLKKEESLISKLASLAKEVSPFNLEVNGFNAFLPRVIYLEIAKDKTLQLLNQNIQRMMKKEFNIFNTNYRDHPFNPHITLAFRDLKKEKFEMAWEEFKAKAYQEEFLVNRFWLLKHDGEKWQPFRSFSLV